LAHEARREARALASIAASVEERPLGIVRAEAEREHILAVLRLTEGHREQAARILGISRKTLWKKLKQLGIARPPIRDVTVG
jgi:DNA-binding NtrC family response regulator